MLAEWPTFAGATVHALRLNAGLLMGTPLPDSPSADAIRLLGSLYAATPSETIPVPLRQGA